MNEINSEKLANKHDEMEQRFTRLGLDFLRSLYSTLKTASLYEANNNRYISQAAKFRQHVAEVFTETKLVSFVFKDGYFFLNNFRITLDTSDQEASEYYIEKFKRVSIGGFEISFKADAREIDKFIFCFSHFKATEDVDESHELFREKLDNLAIENIIPVKIAESDKEFDPAKDKESKTRARKVFFQAIGAVQDIINQAKAGATINLAKTKRVVQSMVDRIIEDEPAMMELTVLHNFDNYTYIHSVNVCVLSLIMGHRLKLDKKRLSDLGVGSLLHDIGKVNLSIDLLNKSAPYDDSDWLQMRMHPVYGVKAIIKTRGTDRSSVRAIGAAYEHHITYTGTGYPQLLQKRTPCLFAQIVSICDTFNAMTSGRIYHKRRMSGDEVITNMVNRSDIDFNPVLLKVFINVIGVYPVGSVVRLTNNEVAIVSRTNPENLENPEVKVIADRTGLKPMVQVIDLSKEATDGVHIQSVIDGEKYNIDPANFIDLG
ncbi:MAG: HD domain-containing protein [candidate division Zixibacteria bacterium]|nr:HD domain-containing protein [candidate division Zixibacteria bacterium]